MGVPSVFAAPGVRISDLISRFPLPMDVPRFATLGMGTILTYFTVATQRHFNVQQIKITIPGYM